MGQAKNRGTFAERKEQALAKQREEAATRRYLGSRKPSSKLVPMLAALTAMGISNQGESRE